MTHSRTSRAAALPRQLMRAQLRIKVMAGVVVVTLVALVAFDIGAVSTMRRYLIGQTDNNLRVALSLTQQRLANFLAAGAVLRSVRQQYPGSARLPAGFDGKIPALPGAFDIVYFPVHGGQLTLQVAAAGGAGGANWNLSSKAAKVAVRPGPHLLSGPNGRTEVRAVSLRVPGGSLVAGTSLDQVFETIVRVELVVIWGSIVVVLLIGLGVFVVLRRGCARSRPWPRRPTGSRPVT